MDRPEAFASARHAQDGCPGFVFENARIMDKALWLRLAKEADELRSFPLDEKTIQSAKIAFLDWLGCVIAGSRHLTPLAYALHGTAAAGDPAEATLIGSGRKTLASHAVIANGTGGRLLDVCDTIGPCGILASPAIMPAALSLSEKHSKSGRQLFEAIIVGYEVAANMDRLRPDGADMTCVNRRIEAVAAAAASARILGLDTHAMAGAMQTAWLQGLSPPALSGMLSAYAAQAGVESSATERSDAGVMPRSEAAVLSGISFAGDSLAHRHVRLHAGAHGFQAAVDAIIELRSEYRLHPEDVAGIEAYVPAKALAEDAGMNPGSMQALQKSIPYCLALAVIKGHLGPDEFFLQNLLKAPVGWLMSNTETRVNEVRSDGSSSRSEGARVVVQTRYEAAYEKTVTHPRGTFENPASLAEIENKFRILTAPAISEEAASSLLERIRLFGDETCVKGLFAGL